MNMDPGLADMIRILLTSIFFSFLTIFFILSVPISTLSLNQFVDCKGSEVWVFQNYAFEYIVHHTSLCSFKLYLNGISFRTRRNLHSHKERAPVTPRHFQVTGYGQVGESV